MWSDAHEGPARNALGGGARQGELAERKGATEGVRRFGAVLVHDHSKAHQKAMAAASEEARATNSPASTYAAASLPVLHKHLRIAEALERQPGG